jgi:hypothetical protein
MCVSGMEATFESFAFGSNMIISVRLLCEGRAILLLQMSSACLVKDVVVETPSLPVFECLGAGVGRRQLAVDHPCYTAADKNMIS